MDAKTLSPVVNTDVKMTAKMMDTLNILEAVSACSKVDRISESEVRAFLAEEHGAAFALKFKPEFLYPAQ